MNGTQKRGYVIWGTGIDAVNLYYNISGKYNISFFIDNKNEIIDDFLGKRVYKFQDVISIIREYKILIAAPRVYEIIKKICRDNNMIEFDDFLPGEMLYKQMVILHGNCHMDIIREFLKSSVLFNDKYFIYDIPRICHNNFNEIEENILKNCKVYIHQDIRPENEYGYKMSDEYIKQFIDNKCIDITVPNLFGFGRMFFPQFVWNRQNMPLNAGNDKNGIFPHGDIVIDKAIEQGLSEEEIYLRMKQNIFEENDIKELFYRECEKLKNREKNWDIKCYNFILQNYKEHKLFYDQGHPTNYVIKYISKEILKMLNIEEVEVSSIVKMDEHEEFVYDCVKNVLGMKWSEKKIRCSYSARKLAQVMDRKEYIHEYVWWKKLSNMKNEVK